MRFRGALLRERGLSRPYAISRPLEVVALELPDPGPGEVLVKIRAASLCRSDLSVVNGAREWPLPMVIGHEAAGCVEAAGSGVRSVRPGDDVVLVYLPQCGDCQRCRDGQPWLCETGASANRKGELITGGTRLECSGEPVHHHMGLAAFAEYALVAEASLVKIPKGLPPQDTCVFGCAVLCGAGSAVNTAAVRVGESVAVIGLGAVGLAAVLGAKSAGAARIAALDRLEAKLPLARTLGASEACTSGSGELAPGFDHAIEASGTAEGFALAMRLIRRGGRVTTLGLPGPDIVHPLKLAELVANGSDVQGSYLGSCITRRDVPRFIDLYREGKFPADALVSHRIRLEEINEALDRLADAQALRQVIEFDAA
ncbi:MAG: alcohol dehydrogenase catalytic domain-containing protein [Betaproteobacteria bacterium]|nr:alcohol dehydrogenase catalytic domain-containing protein [Betaproteobacteria bacterium]